MNIIVFWCNLEEFIMVMKTLCLFLALAWSTFGISQSDSLHVLLIGNSYTYFWNLPRQLNAMAAAQHDPLQFTQSTRGGVNLGQHWRGERALQSKEKIQSGRFNRVILQDHSMRAFIEPDSLIKYGQLFGDLIHASNAQAYVYLTWGRRDNPLMQERNNEAYQKLAQKIKARIIPVGPAWVLSRKLRPDLDLYDPDGSHPSTIGSYLTACVIYSVITGQSPIGLPNRLDARDHDGSILFLNNIPNVDAQFLQQVAWQAVKEFTSR